MARIYIEVSPTEGEFTTTQKEDINSLFDNFVSKCDQIELKCQVGEIRLETDAFENRFIGIDQKDRRKEIFDIEE